MVIEISRWQFHLQGKIFWYIEYLKLIASYGYYRHSSFQWLENISSECSYTKYVIFTETSLSKNWERCFITVWLTDNILASEWKSIHEFYSPLRHTVLVSESKTFRHQPDYEYACRERRGQKWEEWFNGYIKPGVFLISCFYQSIKKRYRLIRLMLRVA